MGTLFATNIDIDQLLATWSAGSGPSDEEVIEYASSINSQLEDDRKQQEFVDNVEQVGTWAREVTKKFASVSRGFANVKDKYGWPFPDVERYKNEWVGYAWTWLALILMSRDVASKNVGHLKDFEHIYLTMIENIKTDSDRINAIEKLESFSKEPDEDYITLSQGLHDLKRKIEDFAKRFYDFVKEKNADLEKDVERLNLDIGILQGEIAELDIKIEKATKALIITGAFLFIIGAIVSGSVLANYESKRKAKAAELTAKKNELENVNRQKQGLSRAKTEFDVVQPDVHLICGKLVLFAEIWAVVQSQTIQFIAALKGGMRAIGNARFELELRLARKLCLVLQNGLEKYKAELNASLGD